MTTNGIPRPLKFNSMQQFVFGNSGQFGQSYRSKSPKSGMFIVKPHQSYYDMYNVNNLTLDKVKKKHIQTLTKNIVLNQEDIHPQNVYNQTVGNTNKKGNFIQTMQPNHIKQNNFMQTNMTNNQFQQNKSLKASKAAVIPHTSQGFYTQTQTKSKQYTQNQLLFNFKKMAQQKKAKKKQFLDTIQAKINQIEQQAKDLQDYQFQQEQQLKQIQKIHQDINRQLTSNAFNGKINQKINENIQQAQDDLYDEEQNRKIQTLHLDMSPVQINHVLNEHYQENQRLLDQIMRVKSKSRQKSSSNTMTQWNNTGSPGKSKTFQRSDNKSFNKSRNTPQKPHKGEQKKIMAATMKYPPKNNKK